MKMSKQLAREIVGNFNSDPVRAFQWWRSYSSARNYEQMSRMFGAMILVECRRVLAKKGTTK